MLPIACGNIDKPRELERGPNSGGASWREPREPDRAPAASAPEEPSLKKMSAARLRPSGTLLLARDPEKELSSLVLAQFMPQPWLGL